MPPRASQTVTDGELEELLKEHLSEGISDEKYLSADLEAVCKTYGPFLMAVATRTPRLNKRAVEKAARAVFESSVAECKMFAQQMEACISYCRSKGSQSTTGKKLNLVVKRIWENFKVDEIPSISPTPSPSPTRGSCSQQSFDATLGSCSQQSADTQPASSSSILALYGCQSKVPPPTSSTDPMDVHSSQDVDSSSEAHGFTKL